MIDKKTILAGNINNILIEDNFVKHPLYRYCGVVDGEYLLKCKITDAAGEIYYREYKGNPSTGVSHLLRETSEASFGSNSVYVPYNICEKTGGYVLITWNNPGTVEQVYVVREDVDSKKIVTVGSSVNSDSLSTSSTSIKDYSALPGHKYKYYVVTTRDQITITPRYNVLHNVSETNELHIKPDNVLTVMDIETIGGQEVSGNTERIFSAKKVWNFTQNINLGSMAQNNQNQNVIVMSQYPKKSLSRLNSKTGTISCVLTNDITNSYTKSEVADEWNEFCANQNLKVIKDGYGNMIVCDISNNVSQCNPYIGGAYYTITFDYTELINNNIAIVAN